MFPVRSFLFVLAFAGAFRALADDAADRHFLDKVKPLLDSRCVSCHGPDKVKGALRLDSRAAVLKGGDNGPGIVPGKPSSSLLLQAVMHAKPDLEMPPKEKLTTNDIAVLRRWIEDGAPWPETATNMAATAHRRRVARPAQSDRAHLWRATAGSLVAPAGAPRGAASQ
jgi:hypothetical protein